MRIRWDETKRQIDLAQLENLLRMPYIEDQRSDTPEQFRLAPTSIPAAKVAA